MKEKENQRPLLTPEAEKEIEKHLSNVRPEVADSVRKVAPHYIADVAKASSAVAKAGLESNEKSTEQVYDIIEKNQDNIAEMGKEASSFQERVMTELSKRMENPNISEAETHEIYETQRLLIRAAYDSETKRLEENGRATDKACAKDSENKHTILNTILAVTGLLALIGGVGAVAYSSGKNKTK